MYRKVDGNLSTTVEDARHHRHTSHSPAISITHHQASHFLTLPQPHHHDLSNLLIPTSDLLIMSAYNEKSDAPTAFAPYLDSVASLFHPIAAPLANTYSRFHGWKENMGLVQPGTVENLTKEVSRTFSLGWRSFGASEFDFTLIARLDQRFTWLIGSSMELEQMCRRSSRQIQLSNSHTPFHSGRRVSRRAIVSEQYSQMPK